MPRNTTWLRLGLAAALVPLAGCGGADGDDVEATEGTVPVEVLGDETVRDDPAEATSTTTTTTTTTDVTTTAPVAPTTEAPTTAPPATAPPTTALPTTTVPPVTTGAVIVRRDATETDDDSEISVRLLRDGVEIGAAGPLQPGFGYPFDGIEAGPITVEYSWSSPPRSADGAVQIGASEVGLVETRVEPGTATEVRCGPYSCALA